MVYKTKTSAGGSAQHMPVSRVHGVSLVTLGGESRAELVPAWGTSTASGDLGNSVATARVLADHQRGAGKHHPSSKGLSLHPQKHHCLPLLNTPEYAHTPYPK